MYKRANCKLAGCKQNFETTQIVIPKCFRQKILALAHDHMLSAHLGVTKTTDRISKYFFGQVFMPLLNVIFLLVTIAKKVVKIKEACVLRPLFQSK